MFDASKIHLLRQFAARYLAGKWYATALVFVASLVWLFTATVNAYLGGDRGILLPAALVSLLCLGLNLGLLRYLYGIER